MAASIRVQIVDGGDLIYDRTQTTDRDGRQLTSLAFLDLPVVAGQVVTVTVAALGGTASVGKLIIGLPVDLGDTETGPTVGIVDYSRRETDDFGITSVDGRDYYELMGEISSKTTLQTLVIELRTLADNAIAAASDLRDTFEKSRKSAA